MSRAALPLVLCAALSGCAGMPVVGDGRAVHRANDISRAGVTCAPARSVAPEVEQDGTLVHGGTIFRLREDLLLGPEVVLRKGSLLATRTPYPGRPYHTVYAVRPPAGWSWLPASGVVQWPAPPGPNAWLSMVSARK